MHPANRLSAKVCLAFILILPLVLFWRWLLRGEVLFWGTTMLQFWPWHHLTKMSLLAGEWPLWNPLLGNGAPLLANLQSGVFYPPNLLYLLLPVEHGLTVSVMLHLALAGLFMYLYMRHLGLLPFAAALSALTYMFSGYIVGRTQFVVMVNAAAWLPLLLLLSDRLAQRRNLLDILVLALVLAVQLLAGHAQLWFYSLWLIGPYVIFRSWPAGGGRGEEARGRGGEAERRSGGAEEQGSRGAGEIPRLTHHALRTTPHASHFTPHFYPLLALFAAILLAVLLSAAQLLPTAEFTTQSPRSSGAERTFALTYSFWPWRLLTLLAPTFFGHPANNDYWGYANYWEDHAYLGVLPFLLAWIALWNYGLRKVWGPEPASSDKPQPGQFWRVVPFFAVLSPLSLVLAMGWNTPIYLWVFQFVPGFGFFQAPARLLIWYTVAVSVLAGIGAQSFKLTPAGRRGWQRMLVAAGGLTIAGLAGSFILTGRSQTFLAATMTLGLWLIISAALLLLRPRKTGGVFSTRLAKEPVWQGAVLVVVALDLLAAAWPLIPTLPAAVFQQPIAAAELLKTQPAGYRFFVDDTFDYDTKFKQYFRFAGFGPADPQYWQSLKETLIPNLGVYADLPATNNYDPLVVGRWQRLVNLLEETSDAQRAGLLALMNVGYFIGDDSHQVGPTLVTSGTMTIQQVPQPLPRAYFVAQVTYAPDEAAAIARLTAPDFDYHREVIIMEEEAEAKAEVKSEAEGGEVAVIEQGADWVALAVEAPSSGFVVLTDSYYRGWQATVDGQAVPILSANLAFRAVAVEAGTHDVVFSYRPRSFTIGLWVSSLTLAGMVITSILLIKRKRN
ncbi:MAG: YfhO family protein [Anaerolineales bacterium]|nr:YfhO family protein [Anaerolineales bacterium]